MIITAVRHGETIENAAGIVQGQSYGTLSAVGLEQIVVLGEKLKNVSFDKIYCSDLERCVKTAGAITVFHPALSIEYDKRLRERKLQPFEGTAFSELGWGYEEVHDLTKKTADGESWIEVRDRLVPFVDFLRSQPEQNILLVTHGGPLRVLDSLLTDQPLADSIKNFYDNCAIRIWEV